MSDDRIIKIADLNKRIDDLIKQYESEAEDRIQEYEDKEGAEKYFAKIEALIELKIELNDPEPATDLEENVQQSLNIIEANKIIKDE